MRCENCGCGLVKIPKSRRLRCPSCELYNAAVAAMQAAAKSLAESRGKPGHAWVNQYGIFVQPEDGTATITLGTPEEAAPFNALTSAARRVRYEEVSDGGKEKGR